MIKKYQKAFSLIEISIVILVIGILIAGISQAIEMFSEASLTSARNLSKSSRISRIDDLSLWLDATSDKAFDKEKDDGSTISMWKDTNPKSTSSASSNSSSASLYPTYILSAISSLPAVRLKKTSSTVGNCVTIPNQSFINNSEDFTLYLIYSPKTLDNGIILEKNNATATNFPFSLELNSGFYKFSVKNSSTTLSVLGAKKANINKPNLIRLSRIKGSQIEIAINGVSSTQTDTLTSSTLNTTELAIGCRNGTSPANFINGDVGEIAFFDRNLTVKEKSDTEDYFYKKWKMKKYEGALANPESTCSVPSSANTDSSITTVQSTNTPQPINCKSGYSGTPTYTCINGVFTLDSGSCVLTCNVPSSANTVSTITIVQPSSSPQSISCKTGYSGTPKYTCINGAFDIASGSCDYDGCVVSTCVQENYPGYSFSGDISCVDLKSALGQEYVNYGASGIYSNSGASVYHPDGVTLPAFSLRWRCNNDRTMHIDIEKNCVSHFTFVFNHGNTEAYQYLDDNYNTLYGYCCGGNFVSDPGTCPWPAW